jgi:O-antigen/teichoic acid export membrane protein
MNEVGIYSLGYKIASLVTVISGGLFAAYNPHFYKLANEGGIDARRKIEKYNNVIAIMMLSICFLIAFFSKEIILLFISKEYFGAIGLIPLLTLGIFVSQINGFTNLMIYQDKKSIQIMIITFVGAITNVVSNLILIPVFGMMGAALATLVSFLILFVIQYSYAKKCFFIPLNWYLILPSLAVFTLVYVGLEILNIQNIGLSLIVKGLISSAFLIIIYLKYKEQIKLLFVKH